MVATTTTGVATHSAPNTVYEFACRVDWIRPSTINPRKHFDEAKLAELADSIARHGLLEPVVVREATASAIPDAARPMAIYEIVAGERRWRAARIAGLEEIPARNLGAIPDAQALELALIENLHRADLDPIEEAEGYAQLNRVVGLKQADIARSVNRSQPAIANAMRLLELPEDVRELIREGELSASHGVALAKWKDTPEFISALAARTVRERFPAKQLEKVRPDSWEANGAAKQLHGGVGFDVEGCRECPFGAYRESDGGYYRGYCLKPSHFAELQAAAEAVRLVASVAKAAEQIGTEEAAALPKLAEMAYDSYRDLSTITTPAGCSPECACRARAIDRSGRVVGICTNPKQLTRLETAKTREENKKKRDQKAARMVDVLGAVDRLTSGEVDKRDLALLAENIVTRVGASQIAVLREALKRQAPALDADQLTSYDQGRKEKRFRALMLLSERQLLRLAVEIVLRRDVEDQFGEYTSGGHVADWYLQGQAQDTNPERVAADD